MSKLESNFEKQDFEVVSREKCYDGFLKLDLLRLRYRLFDGGWSEVLQRELLVKDQAVGILLFDPDRDEIVLVRQFRVGIIDENQSPWLLELVAGMVGDGEQLEQVAMREAGEESNCTPTDLIKMCDYYNSPGASNEKVTLFCGRVDAEGAKGVFGLAEEHEDIEVVTGVWKRGWDGGGLDEHGIDSAFEPGLPYLEVLIPLGGQPLAVFLQRTSPFAGTNQL